MNPHTFRRRYLDQALFDTPFHGKVLDVGGKKEKKRGEFRPPLDKVASWEYVNIDAGTNPDYLCSADAIPVAEGTFDIVLMSEVLEHVEAPHAVLAEARRVLKPGGKLVASMPFLVPVHADPHDFQRWTPRKLDLELKRAGMAVEKIEPMGGLFAVLHDLMFFGLDIGSPSPGGLAKRAFVRLGMPVVQRIAGWLERRGVGRNETITTGYFVVGVNETPRGQAR